MSRPQSHSPVLRVLHSKDHARAYYNKIARVYDLLSEKAERPMREAGLEMLGAQSGERVLEIGFGTGHCLVSLAKAVGPDGRVLGIDISDEMVAITRKRLEEEGLSERCSIGRGDAESLPCEDASLDAVFVSFTLELFDTPEIPRVLGEVRRTLKPGGRLVVVAVSKEGKRSLMVDLYEWTHRHFPNLLDCRPIFVSRSLREAGFQVGQSRLESMWVPVEIVLGLKSSP